jgi:YD repeat-containing protein
VRRIRFAGNLLPDGMTIAYTYDERGQLASLSGYSDGAGTTYGYDALGWHIETTRKDGLATTYAYDARGNLVDITYTTDETPVAGFTYTVDSRGNRTAATEVLHTATGTTERALTYTYDALSRLVAADASFGADYTYAYDVAGNLVDMNGVARQYNAANQLTFDGVNALAYDAAGNLLGDGVNAYTWDTAGRLVGIGAGDDPAYTFSYNGEGDRVAQTVGDITTTYTLDTTPALTLVIGEATGPQRTAFIHDARGIHAQVGPGGYSYWILRMGRCLATSVLKATKITAARNPVPMGGSMAFYEALLRAYARKIGVSVCGLPVGSRHMWPEVRWSSLCRAPNPLRGALRS